MINGLITQLSTLGARLLAAERERLVLWVPVALMAGIGFYFALPAEPSPWMGPQLLLGTASLAAIRIRRRERMLWIACFLAALGFAAAQWRTCEAQGPLLSHMLESVAVDGGIREILPTEKGMKLVLENASIENLAAEETPRRVRISIRAQDAGFHIGDRVRLRATLYPLPGPAMPGAFDFARHFYFEGIGAIGYALTPPEVLGRAEQDPLAQRLTALRHAIAQDMRASLPEPRGAVAAALTVGEQSAISETVQEDMRVSGLAHVLSISGLHLALASGLVFYVIRLALVLIPAAASRVPAKKIAAACALIASFLYLLLAGSPVPAQRAFIMVAFVLTAILLDRRGISLYSLAWAAAVLLLLYPEAMLGASFQMSFAATLAMIGLYETFGDRLFRAPAPWWGRAGGYVGGIALTSLAATLATAPFVITHFNRLSTWGILANMAVIPLASFVIMPGVVLSLLLMPAGLQQVGYGLLDAGIRAMLAVARWSAHLPYASLAVPSLTDAGLVITVFGMLWLILMRARWRMAGIPLIALGMSTMMLTNPPDVLISDDGRQAMARLDDGRYVLLKGSGRAFTAQAWLEALAQEEGVPLKEAALYTTSETAVDCDGEICAYSRQGRTFLLVKDPDALPEACAKQSDTLAVWWYVRKEKCAGAQALIDRNRLERFGAHALWLTSAGLTVRAAREGAARPWMPPLKQRVRRRREESHDHDQYRPPAADKSAHAAHAPAHADAVPDRGVQHRHGEP